jgi:hypothetical protein
LASGRGCHYAHCKSQINFLGLNLDSQGKKQTTIGVRYGALAINVGISERYQQKDMSPNVFTLSRPYGVPMFVNTPYRMSNCISNAIDLLHPNRSYWRDTCGKYYHKNNIYVGNIFARQLSHYSDHTTRSKCSSLLHAL